MTKEWSRGMYVLLALAILLLAGGLLTDFGAIRSGITELKHLASRRNTLRQQLVQTNQNDQQLQRMASFLHVENLADLSKHQARSDPLAYLAQLVDSMGLTRVDLTAGEAIQTTRLKKSQFTVRILGRYERILDFVRTLEQGPRIVTIDAFSIENVIEPSNLEGRFNVSVYDPVGK